MGDTRPYTGVVEGAVYDVSLGAAKFVADVKAAMKGNPGVLPEAALIGAAILNDLVPLISNLIQAQKDIGADPVGSVKSAMLAAFDGLPGILA